MYKIRRVMRDSEKVIRFQCLVCGIWRDIDPEQYFGQVSVECTTNRCTFHKTINFASLEQKGGLTVIKQVIFK